MRSIARLNTGLTFQASHGTLRRSKPTEIVDLYKDSGSNFVADGGDYLMIDATLRNDDLRDLFERVFARLSTPQG
jgi:hypothetical protein